MLISNPLAQPLFLPIARSLAAMLAAGLAVVLPTAARQGGQIVGNSLFVRWRTWACLAPVAVLSIMAGPIPFTALVTAVIVVALREFAGLAQITTRQRTMLPILSAVLLFSACLQPALLMPAFVLSALVTAAVSLDAPFEKTALSICALFYIPFLAAHAILSMHLAGGSGVLLSTMTASALANVAAFTFGKLLGGPKLAPRISPNKTWSGALGSLVGASAGIAIMNFALPPHLSLIVRIVLAVTIALTGILGDLFESQLKRSCGAKDAGSWLPGFGGALDRIDGLLFVLPCVYYLVLLAS